MKARPYRLDADLAGQEVSKVVRNLRAVNWFDLRGQTAVSAKSTHALLISDNRFSADSPQFDAHACTDVRVENNTFGVRE